MAACRELFETNLFGALSAMQAVMPVMRQQGGGSIINISSVAGHIPLPFHAAYSASKFALNAIGKGAGIELRKDGIHVLTVCPGYVRTAFSENAVRGSELKQVRPTSVKGITLRSARDGRGPWLPQLRHDLFVSDTGTCSARPGPCAQACGSERRCLTPGHV